MASISIGKITWDLEINSAGATRALAALQAQTADLQSNVRETTKLFGGLGDNLNIFDRRVSSTRKELIGLADALNRVNGGGGRGGGGGGSGGAGAAVAQAGSSAAAAIPKVTSLKKQVVALTAVFAGISAVAGAASVKLLSFAKDATLLAARVQNLGTVVQNVGRIAGFNASQINNLEKSIRSLGITTRAARQGLAQLAQANIDLGKSAKITRIAQDAAVIAGIDSSEAFNRLVVSIQRNDVRLLRNLGIVINLNSVYRKFSQQTGRTVAQLTAFQKRQLVLNEVIARGALIAGTYEKSLGDVFKQLTSLRRKIEEATLTFGKQFIPILERGTKVATDFFDAFEKGTSFFTAKDLALLTAGVTLFAAAAAGIAAIGAAALALLGILSLSFGPAVLGLAAALSAIALIGGTIALVFLEDKLAALEAAAAIKKLEQDARDLAQTYVDVQSSIEAVNEAADSTTGTLENNADRYRDVKTEANALAQAFPELADRIQDIINGTDQASVAASRLRDLLREVKPDALLVDEKRLVVQQKRVANLNAEIKRGIQLRLRSAAAVKRQAAEAASLREQENIKNKNLGGTTLADTAKIEKEVAEEKIRLTKELADIEAQAAADTERFSKLSVEGAKKEAGLQDILNKTLLQYVGQTRTLTDAFNERAAAAAAAGQTELALNQKNVAILKKNLQELSEARAVSDQEASRIANQAAQRLRGTTAAEVQNALNTQSKLFAIRVSSAEEIRDLVDAALAAELEAEKAKFDKSNKASIEARDQAIKVLEKEKEDKKKTEKEADEEILKIKEEFEKKATELTRNYATERGAIRERSDQKRIDAEDNLNQILESREAVLRNLINANKDLAATNASEAKAAADLRAGVLPEIVNLRQRETKETDKLRLSIESLQEQRAGLIADLENEEGGADLVEQFSQLEPGEVISDNDLVNVSSRARQLTQSLAEVNNAIDLSGARRAAITQKYLEKIEDLEEKDEERKRKQEEAASKRRTTALEAILREEEKLFRRRIEVSEDGQNKLRLLTKKGIDARIREIEKGGNKANDFIGKIQNDLAAAETKGLGGITSTLNEFTKQIGQATSAADLANLKELFPQAIAKNIEDARKELEKAKEALQKFDDVGADKARAKARGEVLARTKELTAAGVKGRLFQEQIQKLERRQFLEQAKARKKLADEVEKQKKRQAELKDAAVSGEDEISKAIDARSKLLRPESQQLGELVTLKEESVRLAKEENAEIARSIELLEKKKAAAIAALPVDEDVEQFQRDAAQRAKQEEQTRRLQAVSDSQKPTTATPTNVPGSLPGNDAASAALRRARGLPPLKPKKEEPTPPAPVPKQSTAAAQLEMLRKEKAKEEAEAQAKSDAEFTEKAAKLTEKTDVAKAKIAAKNEETIRLFEKLLYETEETDTAMAESFNSFAKKILDEAKANKRVFGRLRAK